MKYQDLRKKLKYTEQMILLSSILCFWANESELPEYIKESFKDTNTFPPYFESKYAEHMNEFVNNIKKIQDNLFASGNFNVEFDSTDEQKEFLKLLTSAIRLYKIAQACQIQFGIETLVKKSPDLEVLKLNPSEITQTLKDFEKVREQLQPQKNVAEPTSLRQATQELKKVAESKLLRRTPEDEERFKKLKEQVEEQNREVEQELSYLSQKVQKNVNREFEMDIDFENSEKSDRQAQEFFRYLILGVVFIGTLGIYPLWKFVQTQKDREVVKKINEMAESADKTAAKNNIPDDYFERAKFSRGTNFLIKAQVGLGMHCDASRKATKDEVAGPVTEQGVAPTPPTLTAQFGPRARK